MKENWKPAYRKMRKLRNLLFMKNLSWFEFKINYGFVSKINIMIFFFKNESEVKDELIKEKYKSIC